LEVSAAPVQFEDCPSKIEWDRIPTDPEKKVTRAIKYPGLGVRSVGPVGDFLAIEMLQFVFSFAPLVKGRENFTKFQGFINMDHQQAS